MYSVYFVRDLTEVLLLNGARSSLVFSANIVCQE